MKNYYIHSIDLEKIEVRNDTKENFIKELEAIKFRGYEVEDLKDGRRIVITKPGGKSVYGRPKKEDFLVYIFQPSEDGLWQITHKQILADLYLKAKNSPKKALDLILLLERTLNGKEPNDFIDEILDLEFLATEGETPEALIKVCKWIWGQEDVNYPNGQGRNMSWMAIKELKDNLIEMNK